MSNVVPCPIYWFHHTRQSSRNPHHHEVACKHVDIVHISRRVYSVADGNRCSHSIETAGARPMRLVVSKFLMSAACGQLRHVAEVMTSSASTSSDLSVIFSMLVGLVPVHTTLFTAADAMKAIRIVYLFLLLFPMEDPAAPLVSVPVGTAATGAVLAKGAAAAVREKSSTSRTHHVTPQALPLIAEGVKTSDELCQWKLPLGGTHVVRCGARKHVAQCGLWNTWLSALYWRCIPFDCTVLPSSSYGSRVVLFDVVFP